MIRQRLPYPGGLRKGEDAKQNQRESDALRKQLIADANGWVLSPYGENVWGATSSSTLTASTLYYFWLPRRDLKYLLESAAIYVEVASASQTLQTALYRFIKDGQGKRFVKVAGTDCSFSTTSTGRISSTLARQVEIGTDTELFLGCVASSSTPAYRSGAGARPTRALSVSGSSLPATQLLSAVSRTEVSCPLVTYLSSEATDLL